MNLGFTKQEYVSYSSRAWKRRDKNALFREAERWAKKAPPLMSDNEAFNRLGGHEPPKEREWRLPGSDATKEAALALARERQATMFRKEHGRLFGDIITLRKQISEMQSNLIRWCASERVIKAQYDLLVACYGTQTPGAVIRAKKLKVYERDISRLRGAISSAEARLRKLETENEATIAKPSADQAGQHG